MAPKKKIAQTVITEGKFYTISAANGKVVEVADYNIDNPRPPVGGRTGFQPAVGR